VSRNETRNIASSGNDCSQSITPCIAAPRFAFRT
jgi:hypothetical protein